MAHQTNPHFSPASCCVRRRTAPSGVFSRRGARRTVMYDSAPCEVPPDLLIENSTVHGTSAALVTKAGEK